MEHTILSAQDRIVALEYELFCALRETVAKEVSRIQQTAAAVAQVDVLTSFATVAAAGGYCKPTVDLSDKLDITEGRHPVVEKVLKDALFVPNDVHMDAGENLVAIITGPNMAGKSTYMRQTALIVSWPRWAPSSPPGAPMWALWTGYSPGWAPRTIWPPGSPRSWWR